MIGSFSRREALAPGAGGGRRTFDADVEASSVVFQHPQPPGAAFPYGVASRFCTRECLSPSRAHATSPHFCDWKRECYKPKADWFQNSAIFTHAEPLPVAGLPAGDRAHWEIESRVVWIEQLHANEECELVYEISWIKEPGVWRRFLHSEASAKYRAPDVKTKNIGKRVLIIEHGPYLIADKSEGNTERVN